MALKKKKRKKKRKRTTNRESVLSTNDDGTIKNEPNSPITITQRNNADRGLVMKFLFDALTRYTCVVKLNET